MFACIDDDQDETTVDEVKEEREGGKGGGSEEEGSTSTKTSDGSVGVEEVTVGVVRSVTGREEDKREEGGKVTRKEPENEFMLDGFDFSTSKYIHHI